MNIEALVERGEAKVLREVAERQKLLEAFALVKAWLAANPVEAEASNGHEGAHVKVNGATVQVKSARVTGGALLGRLNKADVVRSVLGEMPARFTIDDVEAALRVRGTELSRLDISFVLSRLKTREEVHAVFTGAGKTPSIFSLKPPAAAQTPEVEV